MRRILLITAAVLALVLLGRWLVRALASDETKIRRFVTQMEAGYNEGDAGQTVGPLAKDWQHEGYEIDRELLLGALFQTSLDDRDRETKQLLTKVDVDEPSLIVKVDGDRAQLECDATFSRFRKGAWEETWRMHASAELADGDDGWKIVKSRHQDLRGTQLGR